MRPIPLPRVTARFRPTRPMPRLWWLLPVMLVTIVAGVVGLGVLARRESSTVPYFACYRNGEVTQFGRTRPTTCPLGSQVIRRDIVVEGRIEATGRRLTSALRSRLTIPDAMIVLCIATVIWVLAGWNIEGVLVLAGWVSVPVLAFVAAACVAGPGHWFPKEPYEGPSVIPLGNADAITALDLVGLSLATGAVLLAVRLVLHRRQQATTPVNDGDTDADQ